jgi:hypothetical protein
MVWFQSPGSVPGQYQLVAASQTTKALGTTGASGDYLEALIIIPATATPGVVTLFDGTTAILSIPALTSIAPVRLEVRAYSKTGSWNLTTGASVSVMAIGQFS